MAPDRLPDRLPDISSLKLLLKMAPDEKAKLLALTLQLRKPGTSDSSALLATLIQDGVLEAGEGFALLAKLSEKEQSPVSAPPRPPPPEPPAKPPTKFVGVDARTLFATPSRELTPELLRQLRLRPRTGGGEKRPMVLFVRANGPGDRHYIDPHAEGSQALRSEVENRAGPQMITLRAFDAFAGDGMLLNGVPVEPGTEDPQFDVAASLCCHSAYQFLAVGRTWPPPTECIMSASPQCLIRVWSESSRDL
eukprot:5210855-Prymnesium_polylepis.2